MTRTASAWIVLKFGGTSVSSLNNWRNIAKVAAARAAGGARVLIVHSAVTGITDRLAMGVCSQFWPCGEGFTAMRLRAIEAMPPLSPGRGARH